MTQDILLAILTSHVKQIVADAQVISQNYSAMNAMGDDIIGSTEAGGHREFSMFTKSNGRA